MLVPGERWFSHFQTAHYCGQKYISLTASRGGWRPGSRRLKLPSLNAVKRSSFIVCHFAACSSCPLTWKSGVFRYNGHHLRNYSGIFPRWPLLVAIFLFHALPFQLCNGMFYRASSLVRPTSFSLYTFSLVSGRFLFPGRLVLQGQVGWLPVRIKVEISGYQAVTFV